MRYFVIFLCCVASAQTPIQWIAGPVVPMGQSPWAWYDSAFQGNVTAMVTNALGNPPTLGAASAGTWTISSPTTCPATITNNSTGASEFTVGQYAIVAWNGSDGAGSGRWAFLIGNISGNVMTYTQSCGLPPNMTTASGLSGLTVYHCPTCNSGSSTYQFGWWQISNASTTWNFYDVTAALYYYARRTGNSTDMTNFRTWGNYDWQWTLNEGGSILVIPRMASLLGQFILALDSHPERLPYLYNMIQANYASNIFSNVDGDDDRETGYVLGWPAMGARADTTNRSSYCSLLSTYAQQWVSFQTTSGTWPEKQGAAPESIGAESPWRIFAANQGLARAYDVLNDTTVCNNPTLASSVLQAIKNSASFIYNAGFTTANSAMFYDLNSASDGLDGEGNAGPGTISVSGTSVVGTGTSFTSTFTSSYPFIGIIDSTNQFSWAYPVASVTDNTHLTISAPYGTNQYAVGANPLIGIDGYVAGGGATPCPSYAPSNCAVLVPQTPSGGYEYVPAAYSNTTTPKCNTTATYCWDNLGSTSGNLNGDPNNIRDSIWIMGWLYKTTGISTYKTWGDILAGASYGGPSGGAGSTTPCGGPNCINVGGVGRETDYNASIIACAADGNVPPCNPTSNYSPANAFVFLGKRFGQGSGIGAFDNYLAWRLGPAAIGGKVLGGGVSVGGVQ